MPEMARTEAQTNEFRETENERRARRSRRNALTLPTADLELTLVPFSPVGMLLRPYTRASPHIRRHTAPWVWVLRGRPFAKRRRAMAARRALLGVSAAAAATAGIGSAYVALGAPEPPLADAPYYAQFTHRQRDL